MLVTLDFVQKLTCLLAREYDVVGNRIFPHPRLLHDPLTTISQTHFSILFGKDRLYSGLKPSRVTTEGMDEISCVCVCFFLFFFFREIRTRLRDVGARENKEVLIPPH